MTFCLLYFVTNYKQILAITVEENFNFIKLLKKIGFTFIKQVIHENDVLQVYTIHQDKILST